MTEGVVNILKPPGMSSSDVVSDVRRIVGTRRVGHAGTLDPGAAGVLPVCIGRATRLFDYLIHGEKEYIAEIAFGKATDTQDAYGRVIETSDVLPSEADVIGVLSRFCGSIRQAAPVYSALSVNGVKMYKLARAGEYVEPRVRTVCIDSARYLGQTGINRFLISVRCSKGTFIRTLCHDIGHELRSCAYMSFLLRTAVGDFSISDSVSLPELASLAADERLDEAVVPPDAALSRFPKLLLGELSERDMLKLVNGAEVPAGDAEDAETVLIYCDGFVGIGLVKNGKARLSLRFYGECEDGKG